MSETLSQAVQLFQSGDYADALSQLERLPDSPRREIYRLAAAGLSVDPVKGPALEACWKGLQPILEADPQPALLEEARQVLSVFANTVFRNCNSWQSLEYAKLQADVELDKKEYLFREFQRILLLADEEYRSILRVLYGYAALADARGPKAGNQAFVDGALKNMLQVAQLQFQIGLQEEFDPLILAEYACSLELTEEQDAVRRELLDTALTGQKALDRWEFFAPYANPTKKKALEKEIRKANLSEKLQFWKRIKAAVRK